MESHNQNEEEFSWCLHCERAYRTGEYRLVGELQMCPYDGCDGDTFFDAWEWTRIREPYFGGEAEYPEIPELGKRYPMYR